MPTVLTNGIETHYELRGSGPPLVFVHAGILDGRQWAPQVATLADEYTTITYDVRGHGRTGGSSLDTYSVGLFADDLAALTDALDLERPVIVGHSTGGAIAQVYAARHPEAVAGLVLASTFTPPYLDRAEWVQRSLMLRAVLPIARLVGYQRAERVLLWIHRRLHGRAVTGEYGSIVELRRTGEPMATGEFAKVARAMAAFHEVDVDHAAIAVPTLVLHGEHEPPFIARHAARLAERLPDATVRSISGAGHASTLDRPSLVNEAIRSFLAERVTAEL